MNIHIIGICGTFMGGVARLARDMGHTVTGSDANTYPPMSTQLESLGIILCEGYRASNIPSTTDIVIVGNSISRGNPELEHVLDTGLRYTSGAQWLGEHVLHDRWVLAVAGTHGKTTTSSLLAWILEYNQLSPGYLIGGVPENFGESARLGGDTPFFVIEADEYDTAFCDKRSKFVHYRPRTVVLNNLEFDHADIFPDLAAIQTQFHHLVRTIPQHGKVIYNTDAPALREVLAMGIWSEQSTFGQGTADWRAIKHLSDGSAFSIEHDDQSVEIEWDLIGDHNLQNAVAAVAAAHHVGVTLEHAGEALSHFKSVKRRMEKRHDDGRVRVYDDFAHHPTAIDTTLQAARDQAPNNTLIAVLEPRSNTMRAGIHKEALRSALAAADYVLIYADSNLTWDVEDVVGADTRVHSNVEMLIADLLSIIDSTNSASDVVIMSNGGFENIHQRLIQQLSAHSEQ
jgi:UDP-N-acetylmuramate: L-alanyl-gamma-D-glutamyl-meso-diaminopimelate ligase